MDWTRRSSWVRAVPPLRKICGAKSLLACPICWAPMRGPSCDLASIHMKTKARFWIAARTSFHNRVAQLRRELGWVAPQC